MRTRAPRSALEDQDRWARVALSFLAEPRNAAMTRLVHEHGAVEALAMLRAQRAGPRPELYVRFADLDLDRLVHAVHARKVRVLVPGDPQWPVALDRLLQPPLCLYVRGDAELASLTERSVAVVGARAATDYGLRAAAELGEGLASRGWTVVSGAAFGIDAAAHRGALAAGGDTVAVLACGTDVAYPRTHERLIGEIAQHGAVVSEVPVGSRAFRGRFVARNRLIAVLSRATVVVEAGLRSGSLTTARFAGEAHLPVGAVPGPVTSATSAGCHQLVREGAAILVTDTADVLELAARIGEYLAPQPDVPTLPTDGLDQVEYSVWSAAPVRRRMSAERLAVVSGTDPARVPGALAVLQALGLVEHGPGGWRKVRSAAQASDP